MAWRGGGAGMIKRMYCMSEVVGPVIPTPVARSPGGGEKRERLGLSSMYL